MKIKGYLNGGSHRGGWVYFDVLDKVPEVGSEYEQETVVKVFDANLDPEQDGDEIYSYDCYKIVTDYVDYDGNHDETERYAAVRHENKEDEMSKEFWMNTDIEIVNIDGELYALDGWNGEKYLHCWKCIDRFTADPEDREYEIVPVYDWSIWDEDAEEFADGSGIIGYEIA